MLIVVSRKMLSNIIQQWENGFCIEKADVTKEK